MHGYERIGNSVLSRDGANLSAVLYALFVGDEAERESLSRLPSQIRQLLITDHQKGSLWHLGNTSSIETYRRDQRA